MLFQRWYWLYSKLTDAELALEPAVARLGERYRCQHLFPKYKHIADFALLDRKRIIEVDGDSHNDPLQKYKDLQHMLALEAEGWGVIRVSNDQAKLDPEGTVQAALKATPQTRQELLESLERLVRDYPDLPERAKPKRRNAKPKRGAGRRGGGSRKPSAKGVRRSRSKPLKATN